MSNEIRISRDYIGLYNTDSERLEPTLDDIKCELQLRTFESWEPLTFRIDEKQFITDMAKFDGQWTDYLPRADRSNNRYGILISGLEGNKFTDPASLPCARKAAGDNTITDIDFCHYTDAYDMIPSLHPLFEYFGTVGRTYILKMGPGSYFPPHKDDPIITRKTFRIASLVGEVDHGSFIWYMDDKRIPVQSGEVAYVDTTHQHGTAVWNAGWSYHLIMSVPKTWENIIKVLSICHRN